MRLSRTPRLYTYASRLYEFFRPREGKRPSDVTTVLHSLFSALLLLLLLPLSIAGDLFTFLVASRLTFARQRPSRSFFRRCRRTRMRTN